MATFSISIGGTNVDFTLSDQDANRILTAFTAFYKENDITPPVEQVVTRIAQEVINGLADRAIRWEREEAASAAAAAVPPIDAKVQS